jgi:hypothetical protein
MAESDVVSPRSRTLAFGSAAAFVVAGGVCAVLVGGVTGEVLTVVLMSLGFGGAVLLAFLEVGLGEERERAKDERRRRGRRSLDARARWPRRSPRRPD